MSRSGKKILHVDRNGYYGGAEAALSLQEAEEWVDFIKNGISNGVDIPSLAPADKQVGSSEFRDANIYQPNRPDISASSTDYAKLGFSRAYSLALSPQLIYSRSALLPTLVSSKVYRQLEFLAVGAWWIYEQNEGVSRVEASTRGRLHRIPGGREDVFADKTIDLKAKRSLMRFLKFVSNVDAQAEALEFWGSRSFADFLLEQYDIPLRLQATLHALTLSPHPPDKTKTSYALPRITRHLASIGIFGSGFGSVIPKWGGLAEVCQVACRAGAVGGGIYMLGRSIEATTEPTSDGDNAQGLMTITLPSNEVVRSHRITGRQNDLPSQIHQRPEKPDSYVAHSVTIVSSTIREIFPPIADGAPPPACTVIVFPVGSLQDENDSLDVPIYLMVHSSDTGECPANRSKRSMFSLRTHTTYDQMMIKIEMLIYIVCNYIDEKSTSDNLRSYIIYQCFYFYYSSQS